MQIGVLPDVFLNHEERTPVEGARGNSRIGPQGPGEQLRGVEFRQVVRAKTVLLSWTGNRDLRRGDCNVYARVTIPDVSIANTYSPDCDGERNPSGCPLSSYPNPAVVAPATGDTLVRSWPVHLAASDRARDRSIGAIELFALNCGTDVCEVPPCLQPGRVTKDSEFVKNCGTFDPTSNAWGASLGAYGQSYLLGRGNVYVGPRVPTAFVVTTGPRDTEAVVIDHWIANSNPRAVILVTPRVKTTAAAQRYAVAYRSNDRRWFILPQSGALTPGMQFNVMVMGNRGPGAQVRSVAGRNKLELSDHLLDRNPNAMVLATVQVNETCVEKRPPTGSNPGRGEAGRWVCTMESFNQSIGVEFDATRGRWSIVSESGEPFRASMTFHVFRAGLPGRYQERLARAGGDPAYFGRLETAVEGRVETSVRVTPSVFLASATDTVFAMHNRTPRQPLIGLPLGRDPAFRGPMAVRFGDGRWQVVTSARDTLGVHAINWFAPLAPM